MYELLPDINCHLCPRLKTFVDENRRKYPDRYNAPVPSFGCKSANLLIVGLAPGLKGANFTGRPFTGDDAGDLLYSTLLKFGFAKGEYKAHKEDGMELVNTRITNAVKCVPPQNKVKSSEINTCLQFLKTEITAMEKLRIILALGLVAHRAVLQATGYPQSAFEFIHNKEHNLSNRLILVDSYHCSRYNVNTRRLSPAMFEAVFDRIKFRMQSIR